MDSYNSSLDTFDHIRSVQAILSHICHLLAIRGVNHDDSKLHEPEKSIFDRMTPKLKQLTYGSDEYKAALIEMGEALRRHYAENSHHPEYYPDGINGMSLLDIIEMFADWKAATSRHNDGDIMGSIEINASRFNISDQLKQILINTVTEMGW